MRATNLLSRCVLLIGGALASVGCATDDGLLSSNDAAATEEVAVAKQSVEACNGTHQVMFKRLADFATAWADEMGQLNPTVQFTVITSNGVPKLALSDYGQQICTARGGCPWVNTFLALQTLSSDPRFPEGTLSIYEYRNWLVTYFAWAKSVINDSAANARLGLYPWTEVPEDNSVTLLGQDGTAACGTPAFSFAVHRDFHLTFSEAGAVSGQYCANITEPWDALWDDNYLCSPRDIGLTWSYAGPIAGMYCTQVNEPWDADGWDDNYLCAPEDFGFVYSYAGAIDGMECVSFNDTSDSGWDDNYLCWNPNANLNHPETLCDNFNMFGGAAQCGGSNPYIDFVLSSDERFKIDPTDYSSSTITTGSSGSCITQLPYVSTSSSTAGACCHVSSLARYGVLTRYPTKAYTYYCKTT